MLIAGAIAASVGAGVALKPYGPERLMLVVPLVATACFATALIATWGVERRLGAVPAPQEPKLGPALRATWEDPAAKAFTGFVFLSILAFT